MSDSRISAARQTLHQMLSILPQQYCLFNIIGFGSNYSTLFPKSVPTTPENLQKAFQHCKSMDADLGGTEILGPLEYLVKTEPTSGYSRQLFVFTDGAGYIINFGGK